MKAGAATEGSSCTWRGSQGTVSVERASPHALRVTLAGKLPAEAGAVLSMQMARELRGTSAQHVFFDLRDLVTYDAAVRTEATHVVQAHRPHVIDALHTFTRSTVVSLGVSLANMALGGFIRPHRDEAAFEEAFQTVLSMR